MEHRFDRADIQPLRGRLFVLLCLFTALSFVLGSLVFFAFPFASAKDSLTDAVTPFFTAADSVSAFAFFTLGEMKFLLLIAFSGLTSAAPILAVAVPTLRAFSAGFAAGTLLALGFGPFPFLIFTVFFALSLVCEAHASTIACLYALFRRKGPPLTKSGRLPYLAAFLTPAGLTLLLALAREALLRLF